MNDSMVGNIVLQNYTTLDGEVRYGLFLVIYDEYQDPTIIHNQNMVCLKVTSNAHLVHYDVPLPLSSHPFLDHDSFVMCSKLHVLPKLGCKYCGHVSPYCFVQIHQMFTRFINQVDEQALNNMLKGVDLK